MSEIVDEVVFESETEEEVVSTRRPTLDELFANEPFLSTTMKAKRLYDKAGDGEEAIGPGGVVPEALPDNSDYPVYPPREEPKPTLAGTGMVSITGARVIMMELTADSGVPLMDEPESISKLRSLKDLMLSPWLRNIGSDL